MNVKAKLIVLLANHIGEEVLDAAIAAATAKPREA